MKMIAERCRTSCAMLARWKEQYKGASAMAVISASAMVVGIHVPKVCVREFSAELTPTRRFICAKKEDLMMTVKKEDKLSLCRMRMEMTTFMSIRKET